LRDAVELLATLQLSDEELAERGIPLAQAVHGPLIDQPRPLIEELLAELDVSSERVRWSVPADAWNEHRQSYDREAWLRRLKRHS
jgi:hypothetical protein